MWAVTSTFCPSANNLLILLYIPKALCFVIGQWHLYMQRKVPRLQLFLDFNSGSWGAWGWCILVGAAACSIPSNFVSTRTFPVGKEGADNPPTMGAETADHTLQFGHDLLLSLPLLSLSLRFKLSLFTTSYYTPLLLLLRRRSSGLHPALA